MVKNLLTLINEKLPIQRVYSDRLILTNNISIRYKSFVSRVEEHISEYLEDGEQLEYYKMGFEEREGKILQVCNRIYAKVKTQEAEDKLQNELDAEIAKSGVNTENLCLLHDMYSEQEIRYVFDTETKQLSNFTYNNLKSIVSPKVFGSLDKIPCQTVYEPFNADINFDTFADGQDELIRVNLYRHPEWRENSDPFSSQLNSLPSLAQDFFQHLYPQKESLNYVLSWLYEALTSEQGNEYVLVLNGPTGTGKTVFASDLMKALFGRANYGKAPKGFFNHDFNAVLENKTLIHGDEAKITFQNEDTFKLYANKELNVHKKGVDANNLTQLYYSMILTNNRIADIYVNLDDRRLSIPEMTSVKILDIWSLSKLKKFKKLLAKDNEFIGEIGEYILERSWEEKGYILDHFTGPKYFKFRYRHLAEWKKIIVEKVFKDAKNGDDEIGVDKLFNLVKGDKNIRHGIQLQTVVEFLEEYSHNRLHKLGELVIEDNEQVLKINNVFIKSEITEEQEDETELL